MISIYKLVWKTTSKVYVGKTSHKPSKRLKEHLLLALSGKGFLVHAAIRQYGEPSVVLLETCTVEDSRVVERKWVQLLNSATPTGFNKSLGGEGKDYWTNEQKQKQSELTKLKLSQPKNRERHLSGLSNDNHRERHSNALKAHYQTDKGRATQSQRAKEAALNRTEAENEMRKEKLRTYSLSPEGNARLRESINTPEAIAKKKASLALYWEKRRKGKA